MCTYHKPQSSRVGAFKVTFIRSATPAIRSYQGNPFYRTTRIKTQPQSRRQTMKPKFKTVGQIRKGNALFTYENHSAFDSVMELLHSRYTGMPVLNETHQVVGVISETDLIRA